MNFVTAQSSLSPDSLQRMLHRNDNLITMGHLIQAEDTCTKVEQFFSLLGIHDSLLLIRSYIQKADIKYLQMSYQASEIIYRDCISILERNNLTTHLLYIKSLDQLALTYRKSGQFNMAKKEYEKLLTLKLSISQKINRSYTVTLGDLSLLYLDFSYYNLAKVFLDSTLILTKQTFGLNHLFLANVYNNLGLYYQKLNDFKKSEESYLNALRIRQSLAGTKYSAFITTQLNLSQLYFETGKYKAADSLVSIVLKSRLETVGNKHSYYATALLHQAKLKKEIGDLTNASHLIDRATEILLSLYSPSNNRFIQNQITLAATQRDLGNYQKALDLLNQCDHLLSLSNSNSLKESADLHLDMASIYYDLGFFEKSEEYFALCKEECESLYSSSSSIYAQVLLPYGKLLNALGHYSAAVSLFKEAESIWINSKLDSSVHYADLILEWSLIELERHNLELAFALVSKSLTIYSITLTSWHPKAVLCSMHLANILANQNKLKEADVQYCKALTKLDSIYKPSHISVLLSRLDYATFLIQIDSTAKATALIKSGLKVLDSSFTKKHFIRAQYLMQFAILYSHSKDFNQSDSCFKEALEIYKSTENTYNTNYLILLREYIQFNERRKEYKDSEKLLSELASVHMEKLRRAVLHLTPVELSEYAEKYYTDLQLFGNIIQKRIREGSSLGQLPAIGYNFYLFYKGFLLHSATQLNYIVNHYENYDSLKLQLKIYNHSLLNEYKQQFINSKEIGRLEKLKNNIEKSIIKRFKKEWKASEPVSWKDVRNKLHKNEMSIEFVSYPVSYEKAEIKIFYAALIVKPGYKVPKFVLLFEESSLDSLLSIPGLRKADYANSLYSLDDRGAKQILPNKRSLSELIYDPLKNDLQEVTKIYYAAHGLLHRINLDAIPIKRIPSEEIHCDETITISDVYHLVRLNNTRQLVTSKLSESSINQFTLYGGIDYNYSETMVESFTDSSSKQQEIITQNVHVDKPWRPIPYTELEVNDIVKILAQSNIKTHIFKGQNATEESFKLYNSANTSGSSVIHFGTHGYFFSEGRISENKQESVPIYTQYEMSNTSVHVLHPGHSKESAFEVNKNPMLRSGLILAGGNMGWHGDSTIKDKEDGVLTAYEISQMNLSDVELVVLSACETGLGEIHGNEGVYGLQRAFKIAGVRYIIMSLWQIPDKQTKVLLTKFYEKWISGKKTIPEALRDAQKELRDMGLDPYHWAGFVLVE